MDFEGETGNRLVIDWPSGIGLAEWLRISSGSD